MRAGPGRSVVLVRILTAKEAAPVLIPAAGPPEAVLATAGRVLGGRLRRREVSADLWLK